MPEENKFDDPKTIWIVLALLIKVSSRLKEKKNIENSPVQIFALNHYPPISYQQVDNLQKAPWEFSGNCYIHLPLVETGGWKQQPVVRASFESQEGLQIFRFQVGLLVEDKNVAEGEGEKCHGIGIRFESAEGPGVHNHFHAQFFTKFDRNGKRLEDCPDWLPDSYPAIPIPADNAVDIICCALKSLYNATDIWRWIMEEVKRLRGKLDDKTCLRIKYWSEKCPRLTLT